MVDRQRGVCVVIINLHRCRHHHGWGVRCDIVRARMRLSRAQSRWTVGPAAAAVVPGGGDERETAAAAAVACRAVHPLSISTRPCRRDFVAAHGQRTYQMHGQLHVCRAYPRRARELVDAQLDHLYRTSRSDHFQPPNKACISIIANKRQLWLIAHSPARKLKRRTHVPSAGCGSLCELKPMQRHQSQNAQKAPTHSLNAQQSKVQG